MRVPLSWLKDFVEISIPIPELAEKLTFAGLEVEDVEYIGVPAAGAAQSASKGAHLVWDRDKIFVGQLVEVKPHPNADRLTLAVVDFGHGAPIQVVTGASNIRVGDRGQKVVLALEGAQLYDGHKEGRVLMTLKKVKIRGVESGSMICSEKELGLSDEQEGVIILPDDAPVGMPLQDYLGDVVLDIKINPNFARAQSVLGVAREIAALTGQRVHLPREWDTRWVGTSETDFVKIEVADPRLCARFSALLIRHVTIQPSPFWMQRRLILAGMRPINNVVDITNYVMLGYGKPLHAFDYDKLVTRAQGQKPTIIVRAARPGERMKTLDGEWREFKPHDILVTDTAGPVGIGGIMGGEETEVSDTTRNVLLESAIFDFISIRRTMQEQKLPSEAATRFGRGIPASQNVAPARLAAELMRDLAGGTVDPAIADNYPARQVQPTLTLTTREVKRILGIELTAAEITRILQGLEFEVEDDGRETLHVTPPDYRTDVDGSDDVIEEIVRIYGYDRVPSTLITDALPPFGGDTTLELEERARDLLVDEGLQEVVTYVFTHPAREAALIPDSSPIGQGMMLPTRPYVTIANPISQDRSVLRQTLLPNLLDVVASNLRYTNRVQVFEIGRVFLARQPGESDPDELPEDQALALPLERRRLALALTGPRHAPGWQPTDEASLDFYDLKGILEGFVAGLHVRGVSFAATRHPTFHPGRAAVMRIGEREVGVFGELHPLVRDRWGLPAQAVLVGEFDLEAILAETDARFIVKPLSRYPAIVQDIALVMEADIPAARVEALIRQAGGALLAEARLFDVYTGAPLPKGKKSLAYRLTFQAQDHVLSDADAAKVREKIVQRLRRELGAELRSG